MTKHGITVIATAMAMAVAATASAKPVRQGSPDGTEMEDEGPPATPSARPYTPDTGEELAPTGKWTPISKIGLAIMGGGGVTNYTKSAISDTTSLGGSWGFRFTVATRRWLSFDASYTGASSVMNGVLGVTTNDTMRLVRQGIEGALRINAPLTSGNMLLSPYALAGAGWNAYKVTNFSAVTASAGISGSGGNTLTVPLAVGFAASYKGIIGDIRGTFRPTYFQSIFVNESGSTLTNWDAGAMIGYEF